MGQRDAAAQPTSPSIAVGLRRARDRAPIRGGGAERSGAADRLGGSRACPELVGPRAGVHRTLASPAADPAGGRRPPAQRAPVSPARPGDLRLRLVASLP